MSKYDTLNRENARKRRVDPVRTCSVCSGPLSERNKTGICARNYGCRVQQQLRRNGGRPKRPPKGDSAWLLPAAYDLDTGEEIVDEVAIRIAVSGIRRVALTEVERTAAILKMIKTGWQYREIADHIGISPARLKPRIEALGYILIPRRQPGSSHPHQATEIRKAASKG